VLITVTAHAMLSAGPVRLVLFASEGPAPGTWRYNLGDTTNRGVQYGRVAGKTGHMGVLRYAADRCRTPTVDREVPSLRTGEMGGMPLLPGSGGWAAERACRVRAFG
jgi:hypothetical protein